MGGADQPGLKADGALAAEAGELALLNEAQQLGLQAGVELADLVEKKRAGAGLLGQALMPLVRAGEGALLMAEERRVRPARAPERRS